MRKIPTMFVRDEAQRGHPVVDVTTSGCEWVLAGEGIATRKLDGQNVKVEWDVAHSCWHLFRRQKPPPGIAYDEASYVPCLRDDPADKWLWNAYDNMDELQSAIYEAVGPQFQGDPHGFGRNELVRVSPVDPALVLAVPPPRNFAGLRAYLDTMCGAGFPTEGVVFVHPDGRLAKIKRRDFGLSWPC